MLLATEPLVATDRVFALVVLVLDDEDHVEPRKDGWHEVDVLGALGVIPAPEHGVGGGEDGAARVESRRDARLKRGAAESRGEAECKGLQVNFGGKHRCLMVRLNRKAQQR